MGETMGRPTRSTEIRLARPDARGRQAQMLIHEYRVLRHGWFKGPVPAGEFIETIFEITEVANG